MPSTQIRRSFLEVKETATLTENIPTCDAEGFEFIPMLQFARRMYDPNLPDHGRYAAKAALGVSIRLILHSVPHGIDLALPLRDLLDGLDDLERGRSAPILERKRKGGGRYLGRGTETFRALAAVLMEIHIRSGDGRDDAAQRTATDLNAGGYCDEGRKPISANRVADWRDKVKEGGDGPGAKRFKAFVEELQGWDTDKACKEVFRSLAVIPVSRIPAGLRANWPAPGSDDTKFGVTMGPEVGHGEAEVYAGVQA